MALRIKRYHLELASGEIFEPDAGGAAAFVGFKRETSSFKSEEWSCSSSKSMTPMDSWPASTSLVKNMSPECSWPDLERDLKLISESLVMAWRSAWDIVGDAVFAIYTFCCHP